MDYRTSAAGPNSIDNGQAYRTTDSNQSFDFTDENQPQNHSTNDGVQLAAQNDQTTQLIDTAKKISVEVVKKYGVARTLTVTGAAVAAAGVLGLLLTQNQSNNTHNKSN
jgi:hypothetical protein